MPGAWVVYDRTWGDGAAYYGIPLKTAYVPRTIKQREAADDLYYGFPLIRELGDQPELWKHSPDVCQTC